MYDSNKKITAVNVITSLDNDQEALSVINYVLDNYGNRDALELVNLTMQEGTHWSEIRDSVGGSFANNCFKIPNELIYHHFLNAMINPKSMNGL